MGDGQGWERESTDSLQYSRSKLAGKLGCLSRMRVGMGCGGRSLLPMRLFDHAGEDVVDDIGDDEACCSNLIACTVSRAVDLKQINFTLQVYLDCTHDRGLEDLQIFYSSE